MTTQHDWLDKHIIDQANHWGCSPPPMRPGALDFKDKPSRGFRT